MTKEQLMDMPISTLRALDITTKEEEDLVQEVLNEKFQNEPAYFNHVSLSSEETDMMTPEKEKELQDRLDGVSRVTASEPVEVPELIVTSTRFCEYCDSKGVRHKKDCTRLATNSGTNV